MNNINELDLTPYIAQIEGYKLNKDKVINKSYTVEDVLIVGLRKLDREFKWQEKFGTVSQKKKVDKLKEKLLELGIDPETL